jgi:hypothetical protein
MGWWARVAVAVVLAAVGVVWFLQGIGLVKGSFMTDQPVWSVIGGALVVLAVGLLARGLRARRP